MWSTVLVIGMIRSVLERSESYLTIKIQKCVMSHVSHVSTTDTHWLVWWRLCLAGASRATRPPVTHRLHQTGQPGQTSSQHVQHATTCHHMPGHVRTGFPVLQLTRNLQLTYPLSLSLSIDSPKEVCGLDPLLSRPEVIPLWSCDNNYKLRLGRNLLRIRKLVQREARERERARERGEPPDLCLHFTLQLILPRNNRLAGTKSIPAAQSHIRNSNEIFSTFFKTIENTSSHPKFGIFHQGILGDEKSPQRISRSFSV